MLGRRKNDPVSCPESGPGFGPKMRSPKQDHRRSSLRGCLSGKESRGHCRTVLISVFLPRPSEAQTVSLLHCVCRAGRSVCQIHSHTFVLVLATTCSTASHQAPCLLPCPVTVVGKDRPGRRASSWTAWCFACSSTDVSFGTGNALRTQTTAVCSIVCLFAGLLFSYS